HVGDVAPGLPRDLAEHTGLRGRQHAVRHADAHHEVAGRRLAMEDAHPLEPLLVVVGDGAPALAREPDQILLDVEAVARRLHGLDAVHDGPTGGASNGPAKPPECSSRPGGAVALLDNRRSRTAQAFSSGWCESGSRADSVRLLALL